jgi:hypothetical protein
MSGREYFRLTRRTIRLLAEGEMVVQLDSAITAAIRCASM